MPLAAANAFTTFQIIIELSDEEFINRKNNLTAALFNHFIGRCYDLTSVRHGQLSLLQRIAVKK